MAVIDTLQLDILVNDRGTSQKIDRTTKSLQNLYNVINQINGTGGVNAAVNGGGTTSRGASTSKTMRNFGRALNFGSAIANLYFISNITRRLGQGLAQVVQYGIDYQETLNLWHTAMRDNIAQARTFMSDMNKAYGISEATLMNYQAMFRNMLSAMGNLSEASSYALSESLTQMALDFASLYNTSVESAMTKLQSVLAGQVRPVRSAGLDITEVTIGQLYQELGGTRSIRQLNQTEKQLLRILAVFNQMNRAGAVGDLKKTITSTANQMRIMKEQAKDFATWAGVSLNLFLQESEILIRINKYLIAFKELAKSIAYELGYVEEDFWVGFEEGAEGAGKEIDNLKGKLLGFDKFQVLNSAGGEDADIEQSLLDAIAKYESILNGFENPAQTGAVELLKQWGLVLKDVTNEEGEVVGQIWAADEGAESVLGRLKNIGTVLGGVLAGFVLLTKPILLVATAIETAYLTNKDFKASVDGLLKAMSPTLSQVATNLFAIFTELMKIVQPFVMLVLEIVNMLLPIVQEIIAYISSDIGGISLIIEDIGTSIKLFLPLLLPLVSVVAQVLDLLSPILAILHMVLWVTNYIYSFIFGSEEGQDIIGFIGLVVGGLELIVKILNTIGTLVETLFKWDWDSLGGKLSDIWTNWSVGSYNKYTPPEMNDYKPRSALSELATGVGEFKFNHQSLSLPTTSAGELEDAVARGFIRGAAATYNEGQDASTTEIYIDGQRMFNVFRGIANRNGYDLVKV